MTTQWKKAVPVLPSLDIRRTIDWCVQHLGFDEVHAADGEYGIVERGELELHFWFTRDAQLPKASSCRIQVEGVDVLYAHCEPQGIVHPNGALGERPWDTREFAVLDPDGNLITFYEYLH